jgi:DNA-binding response OmpR family regulator
VLIVDDNRDAADTLALVLDAFGYQVRTAYDAAAGLDALVAFAPDAAILDIGLPGMDGYALAGKVAEVSGAARPRLLALTGYGTQQDRERALRAGFDEHLVKPVDPERLVAALDRVLMHGG